MDLIESRRYFQCRHCSTFHFPHSVEADGIRIIARTPGTPACPVCKVPMHTALLDEDRSIHFCDTCRGVLLPRGTFAAVTSKRRAWASGLPAEPVPLDRGALARELVCPSWQRRFETYPHYGPGNVVIDNCTACDLIWLDFGEMKQIVDAPGRDRGSREIPRIDEQYVRGGAPVAEDVADGTSR